VKAIRWTGVALLLAACAPAATVSPTQSGAPSASHAPPTTTSEGLAVTASTYGAIALRTHPLDSCDVAIKVDAGIFGDGPPKTVAGRADAGGLLALSYPAPFIPPGHGRHDITCTGESGARSTYAEFVVPTKTLDPRGFTTRVEPIDPIAGLSGLATRLDPSLVPARDAAVAKINGTLESEWRAATRDLGDVSLVKANSDIAIYVAPGKGTSIHSTAADGSKRIVVYVVSDLGPVSAENAVAIALHELGHIWCCYGADAGSDGHWLERIPDPLLQGVDQYGLMTHPVTCLVGPGFESCPNRFSDRELRTMGFTNIPAPPPDPCLAQKGPLASRVQSLDAQLGAAAPIIDANETQLESLDARIKSLERQYPNGMPPDAYAQYSSLVDQYNALLRDYRGRVAAYNSTVDQRNALTAQLNALPC
jgi:hypothetical protein